MFSISKRYFIDIWYIIQDMFYSTPELNYVIISDKLTYPPARNAVMPTREMNALSNNLIAPVGFFASSFQNVTLWRIDGAIKAIVDKQTDPTRLMNTSNSGTIAAKVNANNINTYLTLQIPYL